MFLTSSTADPLKPEAPAAINDSVIDSAPLQMLPTDNNGVHTTRREQRAAGPDDDTVSVALDEKEEESADLDATEPFRSASDIRTRHQRSRFS